VVVVARGGVLGGLVSGAGVVVAGTVVVVAKGGVLGGFVSGAVVAATVVGGGVVSLEGAVVGATVGATVVGGFVSTGGMVSFGLKIVVAMIGGVVSVGTGVVVVTDRGGFVSGDGGLATVDVVVADRGGLVSELATVDVVVADRGGLVSELATVDVVVAAAVVEVADGLRVLRGAVVSVGSAGERVDDGEDSDGAGVVGRRSSPLGGCVVVIAVAKLKFGASLGKALPSESSNGPPKMFDPKDASGELATDETPLLLFAFDA
jgi:hypothetical protein